MDHKDCKKARLLSLVGNSNNITFVDIDKELNESINPYDVPEYLFKNDDKVEIYWAFYEYDNLMLIKSLIARDVIRLIETSASSYAKNNTPPTASKKNLLLVQMDSWVPTVLIKGPNFKKEWERLVYDTSS